MKTDPGLQQRLAAILAADAVGYSRLMSDDERGALAALDAAREVFRVNVAAHQGRVVDTAGDSVLAVFPTAAGAVAAALAVQSDLATSMRDLPETRRLRFRIGVHLGDVIEKADGTVYGDGVNVAARLQAGALPGGITVSESIRSAVRGKVGATFEDLGEHLVKNIAEPIHSWHVHTAAKALVAVPASTAGPAAAADAPAGTPSSASAAEPALPDRPSIAVLPFTNLSGDAEQDYFADGMVEDIITELSRFQVVFVIARNTTFTYKGRSIDVRRVAAELRVQFVLEGSVRRAGDRVRVSAQLIDGETGRHVWAERYDDVLCDVFDLQERITRQVVASMVAEIEAEELRRLDRGPRRFSVADDLAWQAAKLYYEGAFGGQPEPVTAAIELAQRAVALDPACLRAYFFAGIARLWRVYMGWVPDRSAELATVDGIVEAMMQLEPNDSRTWLTRANLEIQRGEFAEGTADLRHAHALNPNDSATLFFLAWCEASEGNVERARDLAAQAQRVSPKDRWLGTAHLARAMCAFIDDDLQALHDHAALAIQATPSHPIRRVLMIAYASKVGDAALLRLQLEHLRRVAPDFIGSLFRGDFKPFHRPEHMTKLLDTLRAAGLGGEPAPKT